MGRKEEMDGWMVKLQGFAGVWKKKDEVAGQSVVGVPSEMEE